MNKEDHKLIAESIWRSGAIKDKNKVRQEAKEKMRRLIAIDLASSLQNDNSNFNRNKFIIDCNV